MHRRVRLAILASSVLSLAGGAAPAAAQDSEVVSLLRELVRTDTSNPPGNEAAVDAILARGSRRSASRSSSSRRPPPASRT